MGEKATGVLKREISAAPPLWVELLVAVGAGVLLAWAAPDLAAWLRGAPPIHTSALDACRAELALQVESGQRYGRVVAGALNGQQITDGARVVACREVR